jgi:hypothetical protein
VAPARKAAIGIMLGFWTRFIHRQVSAINRLAFQRSNSGLAFVTISHGYKSKTTGLTAHSIGNQMHIRHRTVRREELAQFVFAGGKREIAYIQFHNQIFRRQSQSRSRIPGFKSPPRRPHLTIYRAINVNNRCLRLGPFEKIASRLFGIQNSEARIQNPERAAGG